MEEKDVRLTINLQHIDEISFGNFPFRYFSGDCFHDENLTTLRERRAINLLLRIFVTRNLFILNFLDLKNRDKCTVMFQIYVTSRTECIYVANLSIRT